ncbi:MAG: hypothetical protein DMF81_04970 [Acidobacteria bacterium]|nr:MAG: hypothetical protein DMF81_04970 [Acidobacteriota bacterium]
MPDQLLLLALEEGLALGELRLRLGRLDVGELDDEIALPRQPDEEDVVVADEGRLALLAGPARSALLVARPRELAPGARDGVHHATSPSSTNRTRR